MLQIHRYAEPQEQQGQTALYIELPYDMRKRSRIHTQTTCGQEAGLFLERGNILKAGDRLVAESGELIEIQAAVEAVSTVTCADSLTLLKTAYHLGNRHVPLQVDHDEQGINRLRYQEDYVLDDMVQQLGAQLVHEQAPFHPESGAYGSHGKIAGGHHHHADDEHGHSHHHHHSHA